MERMEAATDSYILNVGAVFNPLGVYARITEVRITVTSPTDIIFKTSVVKWFSSLNNDVETF